MHIADFGIGMLGANGIVAGGISIVTGAGLAAQMDGNGRVAVSFFGDGASNAGPFHECLNIAATWKLPMLYVCENNMYAAQTAAAATHAMPDVAGRAAGYGIPGVVVDGNDIFAVYQAAARAVARARAGRRADADRVQDLPLARAHRAHRPARFPDARGNRGLEGEGPDRRGSSAQLMAQGSMTEADLKALDDEVQASIAASVAFAEASPFPTPEAGARRHVCGLRRMTMREMTYAQAGVEAVAEEMRTRPAHLLHVDRSGHAARQGVRREAREGDADRRSRADRHRHRRGGIGLSADHGLAAGHVLVRGHGPDRQPGRQDPLHVRRPADVPDPLPRQCRRRHAARRAALPVPVLDVHEPVGAEDVPAVDAATI